VGYSEFVVPLWLDVAGFILNSIRFEMSWHLATRGKESGEISRESLGAEDVKGELRQCCHVKQLLAGMAKMG
jgi:hypothetical protein